MLLELLFLLLSCIPTSIDIGCPHIYFHHYQTRLAFQDLPLANFRYATTPPRAGVPNLLPRLRASLDLADRGKITANARIPVNYRYRPAPEPSCRRRTANHSPRRTALETSQVPW